MRDLVATVTLWLRTSFSAAPGLCVLAIILNVAQWVAVPIQPYGVKLIIDGLAPGADPALVRQGLLVIMVSFTVLLITGTASRPLDLQLADRTERAFHADLADLVAGIPGIEQHERPDIADQLALLRAESRRMGSSVFSLLFAIGLVGNTVVVAGLLAGIHPAFLALLLVAGVQVIASRIDNNLSWQSVKVMQPNARLVHELIRLCRTPAHAMEIRNFGLRSVLLHRIEEQVRTIDRVQWTARRRGAVVKVGATMIFGLAYLTALGWLLFGGSTVPAGDVALLILLAPTVSSVAGGAGAVMAQFSESLRRFGRYHAVRVYARDHAWTDSTTPAPDRLRTGIELRGVGFWYPGTDVEVLSDLDLTIPAGTSVALVGENGAGKTTLVKLLARMYDPGRGRVIIEGLDLATIRPEPWRRRLSAAFSDYARFEFTAREAIGIGDLDRMDDPAVVDQAITEGDVRGIVDGLPNGLDTQLGRSFSDGVDLSGGQWQRVALARAFMRQRPLLLLLDEPTAAIDPEAEHALYQRFAARAAAAARETGGITVLVSHRFSTVRMADLIVVLDRGRIIEVGSHQELLAAGGHYAELFELQARAYR